MQPATAQNEPFTKRPSTDEGHAKSEKTPEPASQATTDEDGDEDAPAAPWRALFFFTTKRNIPLLIAGVLFSSLCGAVSPASSYVMGKVFEGFTSYAAGTLETHEFMRQEKNYVCYLLIIAGGDWLLLFLDFVTWLAFGELQAKSARDRLFFGLLEKEIEWYDMRNNGIGALLPRIQAQIRELQLATSQPLGVFVSIVSTAVLSLVQALVRAWDLTLVTISTISLVMLAIMWVSRGVQQNLRRNQDKLTEAQKFSTSALSAIETVKCFNGQQIEQGKYMASVKEAASWYYRVANANALQMAFIVLLSVSMFVQGFYYGGILVAEKKRTTADVVTTFLSAVSAFQSLIGILPQLMVLEKGRVAGSTLRAVMAEVQLDLKSQKPNGLLQPLSCQGDIEVTNLTFAYPSRPLQPALEGVNLFIPGGDLTFLIGKSGSGKSTLGQLLMRFYSPTHGHISLDGSDLSSLNVNWLRTNITLVEQTSLLFNDTVFRNIAFGQQNHDEVSREQVAEAVEFALLQSMINDLPNGPNTLVGYKGGSMSGGQRQRMALARARLRDTPILLLDESTSALDRISRTLMMDAIRRWRHGKTTIIVTHDISQILPDDYVYVLQHGKLAQEGYRKHMEQLKGSPFQGFLPDELKATISPYIARKETAFRPVETRASSVNSNSKRLSEIISDPIEAQLNAGENKRMSVFPTLLQGGGPLPALRARGQVAPSTGTTSTWAHPAGSSPSPNTPPGSSLQRWSGWWAGKNEKARPTSSEGSRNSKRWTKDMEGLISRTGRLAADARFASIAAGRRRAKLPQMETAYDPLRDTPAKLESKATEELDKADNVVRQSLAQILSTLWPSLDRRRRTILVLGFWGATIHAVGSPIFSFVLSKLLQLYSIPGGDRHKSLIYSMVILGLAVIDATHSYMFRFFLEYVSQCWVDSVRNQAMKRILDQPRAFFDKEENAVSRLTGSLDRNAEEMRNLLGRFLGLIWVAALMIIVSVVWAMVAQWKMTLIALAAAPYIYATTKAFAAVSEKWESLSNDAAEDAAAIFTETFTNIKTVRALTLEKHFLDKYLKATNYALRVGFRRSFFSGFFYGLSDSAGNFSIAMVFYVGATLAKSGTPVKDVIQVFTMLIFTITNVSAILEFIPQMGSSKDTASRLLRLAQLPEDSHEHLGNTMVRSIGDIRFDDLQFSYPSRPEQTILKHINLRIQPGTSTAIVGGSGSGKSTIANLLLNLYSTSADPNSRRRNDLTLSARDIKRIDTPSLRSLIVPVSQTPTLFAATVAENIAYGLSFTSPYNNDAAVQDAARQAGIHDFIASLPQGYSTPIGDGGMGLSGGQAQRIAIARALIRKPAVLILDEATSALDVESANLVRQTVEDLVRQKERKMTVIIITHNRDMMEIAEKVVVLDQGRIVEEGGFEELMERNGALANLLSGGEWNGDRNEDDIVDGGDDARDIILADDSEWRGSKGKASAVRERR